MILPDVNVLLYAFRRDSPQHEEYRAWLLNLVNGLEAYAIAPQTLAALIRISTHPGIYVKATSLTDVLAFCEALLDPPHCQTIQPGQRHWSIFTDLCRRARVKGNLVQDAWFAALAIEHGCEWITTDRDYARFEGLRWRAPFLNMKIRDLQFTTVSIPFVEPEIWSGGSRPGVSSTIVEVLTDDGVTGIGEALPAPSIEVTAAALANMRELLLGEDPLCIEHLVHKINSLGGFYAFPTMANAVLGGIEMALWDILGKATGQPVHTFFGGPLRDEVPFMYFVQRKAVEAMQQDARRAVEAGFGTVYTKVGLDYSSDVEAVRALREAIGPKVHLRVDANEGWSPGTAVRILEAMRPYDLQYIEQPTRMSDIDTLKWLRQRTTTPIAANQSSWTNKDLYQVLAAGAVDVVMTDPHQAGGLLALKKASGIAEAAGVPIVFHSFGPLAITTYAAMQVIATSSNFMFDNQTYNHMLSDDVVTDPPKFERGRLRLPRKPGIGVELDRDKVARYADLYRKQGYLSAYDTTQGDFAEIRKQESKILWFPNQ